MRVTQKYYHEDQDRTLKSWDRVQCDLSSRLLSERWERVIILFDSQPVTGELVGKCWWW